MSVYRKVYAAGLQGVYNADMNAIKQKLADARALPRTTKAEKELRSFAIEEARIEKRSRKTIDKYFKDPAEFVQPDFAVLEGFYEKEDNCDEQLKAMYAELRIAKKANDRARVETLKENIKETSAVRKAARADSKAEMEKHAYFSRAAKPYLDAEKLIKQEENYQHLDEITAMYDDAKARYEQELAEAEEQRKRLEAEEKAYAEKLKAEKAAKKQKKK